MLSFDIKTKRGLLETLKSYLKLWGTALFFFTGTFLHELSHFIMAKLTGARVVGFSMMPKLSRDTYGRVTGYEYGSVNAVPKFKGLMFLVGFSPILLWALLWYILVYVEVIIPHDSSFNLDLYPLLSFKNWWIWFAAVQLLWSGMPSVQDIKVSINGFASFSGAVLIAALVSVFVFQDTLMAYREEVEIWFMELDLPFLEGIKEKIVSMVDSFNQTDL